MSFAMLCGPDGGFVIAALVVLVLMVVLAGSVLATAIYVTIALAKWAAARHNRLAAN